MATELANLISKTTFYQKIDATGTIGGLSDASEAYVDSIDITTKFTDSNQRFFLKDTLNPDSYIILNLTNQSEETKFGHLLQMTSVHSITIKNTSDTLDPVSSATLFISGSSEVDPYGPEDLQIPLRAGKLFFISGEFLPILTIKNNDPYSKAQFEIIILGME